MTTHADTPIAMKNASPVVDVEEQSRRVSRWVSILYLVVALCMGLLISSAVKSQFLASQVALLTSFLPAVLLSGFLFDLRNVSLPIRVIGDALPATHFMALVKTLFLAGDVVGEIVRDSAILVAYALVFFAAARAMTRKRLR